VTCPYVAGEGWFDLYLDMSKNIHWCGILTGIRIDPENDYGVFEVELVEIIEAPEKSGSNTADASVREFQEKIEDLEYRLEELHCSYEELFSQYEDLEEKVEELEAELNEEK
jgi:peptidoglycan hydrolase CwlO-like protein